MIVILIVFVIGTKLHDKWIGLLAAFFYSVTVFSIQMAHFGTVDAMANLFSRIDDSVRRAGAARGQADALRAVRDFLRLRGRKPHQSRAAGGADRCRGG